MSDNVGCVLKTKRQMCVNWSVATGDCMCINQLFTIIQAEAPLGRLSTVFATGSDISAQINDDALRPTIRSAW